MAIDRNHPLLKPDNLVYVNRVQGYVVAVHDDSFDFGRVTNAYEHFSNVSAPAELDIRRIRYADVDEIST